MKSQANLNIRFVLYIAFLLISNLLSAQKVEAKKIGNSTLHEQTSTLNTEQLLARIIATEDRLEILNLLAGSAFSSDVASESYWTNMFTEDAIFDRGPARQDKGRDEIMKIVNAPAQNEAIKAGMTHLAMLPHITINGDTAVATGYLLVVMPDTTASHVKLPGKGTSPGFSIYQLTVNQWKLLRTIDGWKVTNRTVRPISSTDSRAILQQSIEVKK
ncbi:nuclear transport factor 2 family protein [Flavobacterium yafengii]|uniref:nuclear transport factor 2 family protein n=1 Tax=Flavobacterium yafengii TaxID=3041253 RepID=UPI0024A87FEB|nr:nuclear transport factor 2 family protein [Flavobacterium yafengii]MDI5899065.1 nuclear transport factor 2 family protein [Flavobacterium yafengii]MDI6046875.1 nuclear transport factor 2 family protein [Flavobacterium yafengii]